MKLDVSIACKLETICYIINIDHDYYTSEEVEVLIKHAGSEQEKTEYSRKKCTFNGIGNLINENNQINSLEELNNEKAQMKSVGIPGKVADLILDTALRNSQQEKMHESKLIKKRNQISK